MFLISNPATGTFPAIRAIGENEQSACAIYAVIYNSHLLCCKDGDVLCNYSSGVIYTTYLTLEWSGFAELAEHMGEVHEVTLTAQNPDWSEPRV